METLLTESMVSVFFRNCGEFRQDGTQLVISEYHACLARSEGGETLVGTNLTRTGVDQLLHRYRHHQQQIVAPLSGLRSQSKLLRFP